jgi:hypothetical protein
MLVPILVIASLVSLYIGSYLLNKKVEVPEEFKLLIDDIQCTSCHISTCSNKK